MQPSRCVTRGLQFYNKSAKMTVQQLQEQPQARSLQKRETAQETKMKIRWLRKEDEALLNNAKRARRKLGHRAALTFEEVIGAIDRADDFRELVALRPSGMHRLTGDRRTQWAIRLSGKLRLIVQPDSSFSVTIIVEIVDYHRRRRR